MIEHDLMRQDFVKWLDYVYSHLDCVTCNSITLLRYKLYYREQLSIVDIFLFIALLKSYLGFYGQVKST